MTDEQIIQKALDILEGRMRVQGVELTEPSTVSKFLRLKLGLLDHEVVYIFYLNVKNRVIHHEEKFHGSLTSSHIYPREILKSVLLHNASAIIIAHNHPSGSIEPSKCDYDMTRNLMKGLAYIDCPVLDHIVVTAEGFYSMSTEGTLPIMT